MTPAATDEEEPAEETEEAQVSADVQQDQAVEALDSGDQWIGNRKNNLKR